MSVYQFGKTRKVLSSTYPLSFIGPRPTKSFECPKLPMSLWKPPKSFECPKLPLSIATPYLDLGIDLNLTLVVGIDLNLTFGIVLVISPRPKAFVPSPKQKALSLSPRPKAFVPSPKQKALSPSPKQKVLSLSMSLSLCVTDCVLVHRPSASDRFLT